MYDFNRKPRESFTVFNNNGLISKLLLYTWFFGHYIYYRVKIPVVRQLLYVIYRILDLLIVRTVCSSSVPPTCKIGKNIILPHPIGIVIHDNAVIGDNVRLLHQVTIGRNRFSTIDKLKPPTIGNNVFIGAGAKLIGPIHIGDDCIIGVNAVITKNIPDNSTVVEFSRIIPTKTPHGA